MFDVAVVNAHEVYETKISASQCKAQVHRLDNAGGEVIPCRGILLWRQ